MFKLLLFKEDLQNNYFLKVQMNGQTFWSTEQKSLKEWRTIYGELCDNVPVKDR